MTTQSTALIVVLSLVIVHGRIDASELATAETDLYALYIKAIAQDFEIRAAKRAASEALPQARAGLLPDLSVPVE